MTATLTKTAQTSTERAFNILAGICVARGLPIVYTKRESNAAGSLVHDLHIVMHDDLTEAERLDTLLDLLAQREMSGKPGAYHSIRGKQNNPFARLAKTLMCELLDESEGF